MICVALQWTSGGYRLAWIGFVEHDEAKTVRPVAWAGEHPEFVEAANITWADAARGRGPTGTAIRTGEAQVNQNVASNPAVGPWLEELLKYGLKSSIALPLKNRLEVFGAPHILLRGTGRLWSGGGRAV